MKKNINEIKYIPSETSKEAGFVALVAVLIASILLAMALSIATIAYKEQLLSINAKSSQYSFIAADSGMECALLYDVKKVIFPNDGTLPAPDPDGTEPVKCGDQALPSISTSPVYKLRVDTVTGAGNTLNGCAIFSINKLYTNRLGQPGTKIESRGYNVDCDLITIDATGHIDFLNGVGARAVERLLTAEYIYISTGTAATGGN